MFDERWMKNSSVLTYDSLFENCYQTDVECRSGAWMKTDSICCFQEADSSEVNHQY